MLYQMFVYLQQTSQNSTMDRRYGNRAIATVKRIGVNVLCKTSTFSMHVYFESAYNTYALLKSILHMRVGRCMCVCVFHYSLIHHVIVSKRNRIVICLAHAFLLVDSRSEPVQHGLPRSSWRFLFPA